MLGRAQAPTLADLIKELSEGISLDQFVSWYLFVPVVWFCYAWQPGATAMLLLNLRVRFGSDPAAEPLMASFIRWYTWFGWIVGAGLFAAWELYWFLRPGTKFVNAGPWVYAGSYWQRIPFVMLASLTYYAVTLVVIRQMIVTVWLCRVFRRVSVDVSFAHPDGRGGLGFLGTYLMGIWPLVALAGVNILVRIAALVGGAPYGSPSAVVTFPLLVIVYVVASNSLLAPVWYAHSYMCRIREARFMPFAQGFDRQQAVLADEMSRGTIDPASVQKLEAAKRACDLGRQLPVWPMDLGKVQRIVVALFTPLLPVGVKVVDVFLDSIK